MKRATRVFLVVPFAVLALARCSGTPATDAGSPDAGQSGNDGGPPGADAGPSDGGGPTDAGGNDAGPADAGACGVGGTACAMAATCPAQTSPCVTNTCAAGCCGTANAAQGTFCSDNGGHVCDGNGHCAACVQPSDCPAQSTACLTDTCTANICGTANAPQGTSCTDNGGTRCDGAGQCVQCGVAGDCPATGTVCLTNTCNAGTCGSVNAAAGTACADHGGVVCDGTGNCVANHCADGIQDVDETDVDCGGPTCAACPPGKKCLTQNDC